jgi:hypothetical protein
MHQSLHAFLLLVIFWKCFNASNSASAQSLS